MVAQVVRTVSPEVDSLDELEARFGFDVSGRIASALLEASRDGRLALT
jgi:hypothetical protein